MSSPNHLKRIFLLLSFLICASPVAHAGDDSEIGDEIHNFLLNTTFRSGFKTPDPCEAFLSNESKRGWLNEKPKPPSSQKAAKDLIFKIHGLTSALYMNRATNAPYPLSIEETELLVDQFTSLGYLEKETWQIFSIELLAIAYEFGAVLDPAMKRIESNQMIRTESLARVFNRLLRTARRSHIENAMAVSCFVYLSNISANRLRSLTGEPLIEFTSATEALRAGMNHVEHEDSEVIVLMGYLRLLYRALEAYPELTITQKGHIVERVEEVVLTLKSLIDEMAKAYGTNASRVVFVRQSIQKLKTFRYLSEFPNLQSFWADSVFPQSGMTPQ